MFPDLDGPGGGVANGTEHYSPAFEHEYLQRQSSLLGNALGARSVQEWWRWFQLQVRLSE